ncbi:MAG: class II aldolase/adducin family protein [Kofleriaceae bacterium]
MVDAVIVGNHGVFAWGADPEQALLRLELVEHLARVAIAAASLGGIEPLPDAAIGPCSRPGPRPGSVAPPIARSRRLPS